MRYMMLIYSQETTVEDNGELAERDRGAHRQVMEEATAKGVLVGAEPLASTASATVVRWQDGKPMITDGPYAETKEQLAGYYIIECKDLEEALAWAAKIPTSCKGAPGCIEVRPMPGLKQVLEPEMARSGNA